MGLAASDRWRSVRTGFTFGKDDAGQSLEGLQASGRRGSAGRELGTVCAELLQSSATPNALRDRGADGKEKQE